MQLTRSGKAPAGIAVAPDASSVKRFAAGELARYVRKISGARLPVGVSKNDDASL